jgi:hypothetical protein
MNISGSVLTLKKIAIAHISGWLNVYGQFKFKKRMHEPNLVFYLLLKNITNISGYLKIYGKFKWTIACMNIPGPF